MTTERTSDLHKRATPEIALQYFIRHHHPSWRALQKLLAADGYITNHSTLCKWAKSDSDWQVYYEHGYHNRVSRIFKQVDKLMQESVKLTPDIYSGVQVALVTRLGEVIPDISVSNADDFLKLLEAADKMQQIVHNARGLEIATQDGGAKLQPAASVLNLVKSKASGPDTSLVKPFPKGA